MKTQTEKLLRHKKKRKGILVPLLEDLFQSPVEVETQEDIDFIADVLQRQITRHEARGSAPLFSPSQLSECLRYVYLLKHHKELGIEKVKQLRVEPNFYFFNGNWLHLKWQFALYKLEQHVNDPKVFKLHGCEVPIVSKRKDHGGTVDVLCSIYEEGTIVDFKGLNVRAFANIANGDVPPQYAMQLADYGMLYNSQRKNGSRISRALLVSENKGGPTPKHLIALHESEITVATHLPEVKHRLEVLREHADREEIPRPECVTTKTIQFQGCPFRGFCKEEVKAIERRAAKDFDADGAQVAVPNGRRDRRTRGNSQRRRSRTS